MNVLVLNFVYRPIAVMSWQDAVTNVYSGRAEIIEHYPDRTIKSASQEWPMPCVVRFLRKKTSRWFKCEPRFTRKNVWIRDRGRCQYCGKSIMIQQFTLDHVMPRSRGGKTDWGNIVAACDSCNQKTKALTPVYADMNRLTTPEAPQVLPLFNDSNDPNRLRAIPEVWKAYLAS